MVRRTRDIQKKIWLTPQEERTIAKKMEMIGTENFGAYARKMLIDGYIIVVDYTEQKKLAAEINKIGVNINTVCRRINSTGRFYRDDIDELKEKMVSLGEKPFKGKQLYQWLHQKAVGSYEEMTNLSESLRQKLTKQEPLTHLEVVEVQTSKIDGTQKYLFRLADGNVIESVWMKYKHGNSVCISSQVGCRMGCRFCASTIGGLTRNLLPSEMLDQVYRIQEMTGERVSNVVVMGTGEPLDNYDNLLRFIRILSDEKGQNISQRNLTVSTCGLVPRIRQLADLRLGVTLSVSLHSPENRHRSEIMPINRRYPVEELLDACRYYFDTTGRRVTIEYAVINGVNNTRADALQLARRLRGMQCHVNLIPVNPIRERSFRSFRKDVERFQRELTGLGINATIRRTLGSDIQAACGQLRRDADQQKQTAAQTVKNESGNTLFGGGKN